MLGAPNVYAIEYLQTNDIERLVYSSIPSRFNEQVVKSPVEVNVARGVAGVLELPFDTCIRVFEQSLKSQFPFATGPAVSSFLIEGFNGSQVALPVRKYEISKFNTVFYSPAYSAVIIELFDASKTAMKNTCVVSARRVDSTFMVGLNPHSSVPYPIAGWTSFPLITSTEVKFLSDAFRLNAHEMKLIALTSEHWSKNGNLNKWLIENLK